MPSFNAIPMDIIHGKILHPHILANNPETANLLAIRATCINFWRELSIGKIMGLRDETLIWLFRGKTREWKDTKAITTNNIHNLFVCKGNIEWSDQRGAQFVEIPNDGHSYATAQVFVPLSSITCTLHVHAFRGGENTMLTDSARFITALLAHDRKIFIVSKLGTIYQLSVDQIVDFPRPKRHGFIRHITTMKQFSVPLALPGEENRFQLRDGCTTDGDVFIFLTTHNYLLSASYLSPSKRMTILASEITAFTIVDDAILYQTTYGTIGVLSLKQRHTAAIVDTDCVPVKKLVAVPELRAMWFADKDGKVYYKA